MTSTAVIASPQTIRDRIESGLRRFADEIAADDRIPVSRYGFGIGIVAPSYAAVLAAARTQDAAVDEQYDDQDRLLKARTELVYDGLTVTVHYHSPEAMRLYDASQSYAPVVQA